MRLGKEPTEEQKNPFKKMNDGIVIARNVAAGAAGAVAFVKLVLPKFLRGIAKK